MRKSLKERTRNDTLDRALVARAIISLSRRTRATNALSSHANRAKNHAQCLPERGPPDPRPASAARYRAGGIAQPLERLPAWPRGAMAGQTAESPEVLRIGVGDFLLEGVVRRACGGSATTIR